jgi:hypothetical protein
MSHKDINTINYSLMIAKHVAIRSRREVTLTEGLGCD